MKSRRKLGAYGPEMTPVGFGAGAIGYTEDWTEKDDGNAVRAIRHALDRGVNWIETAAVYGIGHSERVVGQVLRALPAADRPMVVTKGGLAVDPGNPGEHPGFSASPEQLRRDCDESLTRLGVDVIDVYLMHWPGDHVPVEESWAAMAELAPAGKVRWIGVSNFSADQLRRCQEIRHVDCLSPPFSLIKREAAAEVLPWCAANGTGVLCYSPLEVGLLTGRYTRERAAELRQVNWRSDWRSKSPEYREPRLSRNLDLVDTLRGIAGDLGTSVAAVALAWALSWGITGTIVGAKSPEQAEDWLAAGDLVLAADQLVAISEAVVTTGAGDGPVH
ncbi:aldo/keto reductase [Amycolatopsis jejuensis]|uniref:aldo/keto reductase n=1 Tax=Amycolatopsis jejuensis TaxID=330084 RepID=UPI000527C5AC|nr:aldo/keto reductase [Amycolatopsis jejuensis]